jgi:hypothetical protein
MLMRICRIKWIRKVGWVNGNGLVNSFDLISLFLGCVVIFQVMIKQG